MISDRFCRASATCARWAALVACIALLAMMALMVADVLLRYLFSSPITGAYDLISLGMLVVVFLGLAHTGEVDGHVAIDMAANLLPARGFRRLSVVVAALSALLLAVIAWQCVVFGAQLARLGERANTLHFPLAPLAYVAAAGALLYSGVLIGKALKASRDPTKTR